MSKHRNSCATTASKTSVATGLTIKAPQSKHRSNNIRRMKMQTCRFNLAILVGKKPTRRYKKKYSPLDRLFLLGFFKWWPKCVVGTFYIVAAKMPEHLAQATYNCGISAFFFGNCHGNCEAVECVDMPLPISHTARWSELSRNCF